MSELTFNEYQESATETAIYPGQGSLAGLNYAIIGLGNESGEALGKLKKVYRDHNGVLTREKREDIAKELGDVLWYAAQVATELGFDLSDIADYNLAKLYDRKVRGVLGGSGDDR